MNNIYFYYPRDKHGNRLGHSIAVLLDEGKVFFGFSQLGLGDKFNRKIGRAIAESRARQQLKRFQTARDFHKLEQDEIKLEKLNEKPDTF